jgi:rod shape-determining protein MreD
VTRIPRGWMVFTTIVALFLTVLPLPTWLDAVRPAFVVLVVLYFSITWPRAGGIGLGFFAGLALDALEGPVIGEHALVLSSIAFIAVWEHQRIRSKPAFQQSLIMFFALVLYEFLLFLVDAWTGHPNTDTRRWLHPFSGALIWPIAIALLERGHSPR